MSTSSHVERRALTPQRIAVLVLVALVIVFAALNSQDVTMHWIVGTTDTPLFVVMLLFAAIGLAIGWFAGRRGKRD